MIRGLALALAAFFTASGWTPPVSGASGTLQERLTVTDSLGRTVAVPARPRRILSLQPEITRLIVALGAGDRLVGIDHFLRRTDRLFPILYPPQSRLPLVSRADYNVNLELLTRLAPEVVFGAPEDKGVVDSLQAKTSIPVAALSSMGRFDRLMDEMRLLGLILGREERAAKLGAFFEAEIGAVKTALAGAPVRPRVYLAFWGSATRTPVSYEPVEAAGGLNVARGMLPSFLGTLVASVDIERIMAWNPDVILVHGNYPPAERTTTIATFLHDRRLAGVRAVKDRRVHYTFGFWNWWDPAEVLLETKYLARLFHPGLVPDFDLVAEGDRVFETFYGLKNGASALSRILDFGTWLHAR